MILCRTDGIWLSSVQRIPSTRSSERHACPRLRDTSQVQDVAVYVKRSAPSSERNMRGLLRRTDSSCTGNETSRGSVFVWYVVYAHIVVCISCFINIIVTYVSFFKEPRVSLVSWAPLLIQNLHTRVWEAPGAVARSSTVSPHTKDPHKLRVSEPTFGRNCPMDLGAPPLEIKNLLESNPLKSRLLVHGLAARDRRLGSGVSGNGHGSASTVQCCKRAVISWRLRESEALPSSCTHM